nr:hypothetical protein [Nitrosococcus watsonii]
MTPSESARLGEATRDGLMQKLRDQDTAFRNFFVGRAKYPKCKKEPIPKVSATASIIATGQDESVDRE